MPSTGRPHTRWRAKPSPSDHMNQITLTHVGGPTVLLTIGGWRILTDPTFDPPGRRYNFGFGAFSIKTEGPALAVKDLMPIDAVLLTHDHHADNLDDAGRELLDTVPIVLTTTAGSGRLPMPSVTGLSAWDTARLEGSGKEPLSVLATPCRHGPPLSRPITGEVIGFALKCEDESSVAVWFSGDSVYYRGLREVARRLDVDVDVAVIHLGHVRFRSTGPFSYTLNARRAVKLLEQLNPRVAVPVHTDGWSHFTEDGATAKRVFASAPDRVSSNVRWLNLGNPTSLTTQTAQNSTA